MKLIKNSLLALTLLSICPQLLFAPHHSHRDIYKHDGYKRSGYGPGIEIGFGLGGIVLEID